MAEIYYVSMLGNIKTKAFKSEQVTKAYPTWLGCKRVLNSLRRNHPSVKFRMDVVSCPEFDKDRLLDVFSHPSDFTQSFKRLYL